jgi:hypothetical protein
MGAIVGLLKLLSLRDELLLHEGSFEIKTPGEGKAKKLNKW